MQSYSAAENIFNSFQSYLGDGLGSSLKVGFSLTASSRFVQNCLCFLVVFEVELVRPELEIKQPLCSPDVVHGRDKRQVDPRLLIELMHHLCEAGAHFAPPCRRLEEEEDGVDQERHHHPNHCEASP